jgi:hypothetical protein
MTAAWKQKKFERLAQKDLVEKLKGEVKYLQDRLAEQKESRKYYEERMKIVYQQRDEAMILANRYNLLRSQELMIATSDGFKLVTGEDLDIHCGAIPNRESPRVNWPPTHMTYTISPGEALDSWHLAQQSQKFNEALRRSIVRTREAMKEGIEIYGLDTGSIGQEEDTQNP